MDYSSLWATTFSELLIQAVFLNSSCLSDVCLLLPVPAAYAAWRFVLAFPKPTTCICCVYGESTAKTKGFFIRMPQFYHGRWNPPSSVKSDDTLKSSSTAS